MRRIRERGRLFSGAFWMIGLMLLRADLPPPLLSLAVCQTVKAPHVSSLFTPSTATSAAAAAAAVKVAHNI